MKILRFGFVLFSLFGFFNITEAASASTASSINKFSCEADLNKGLSKNPYKHDQLKDAYIFCTINIFYRKLESIYRGLSSDTDQETKTRIMACMNYVHETSIKLIKNFETPYEASNKDCDKFIRK
ncbi:MAG: hypothetical protein M9962_01110 [Oligoflexia bacterium]|nr:hypothetical protein [Oligoflexia bacterium]